VGATSRSSGGCLVAWAISTACGDVPLEGQASAQREKAHAPQRIEIAPSVEIVAAGLLGAHVVHGAQHQPVLRARRVVVGTRDAEVGHDRAARAALDEDVLRLDVAVHDAACMRVGQCPRHLPQHAHRIGRRQCAAVPDAIAERLAIHVAHGEEGEAADLVGAVHRHDVGMRELRGHARLAQESLARVGLLGERGRQHLEGHLPVEAFVAGEQHDAHAATSELALDVVLPAEGGTQRSQLACSGRIGGWEHLP
jgi:hypothetical protein